MGSGSLRVLGTVYAAGVWADGCSCGLGCHPQPLRTQPIQEPLSSKHRPMAERTNQLFFRDWCAAGPWGGIQHPALLSSRSSRCRCLMVAQRCQWLECRVWLGHMMVSWSPICRHLPHAETRVFQSMGHCSPITAPLLSARKKICQELRKK